MSNSLQSTLEMFVFLAVELSVLFLGVSLLVGAVQRHIPAQRIEALLSGQRRRGYVVAAALGAITPFCSCSTIPMLNGLIRARAGFGPMMVFLFASPLLNPIIVVLLFATFGLSLTAIYVLASLLVSLGAGWTLQRLGFERFVRRTPSAGEGVKPDTAPSACCGTPETTAATADCCDAPADSEARIACCGVPGESEAPAGCCDAPTETEATPAPDVAPACCDAPGDDEPSPACCEAPAGSEEREASCGVPGENEASATGCEARPEIEPSADRDGQTDRGEKGKSGDDEPGCCGTTPLQAKPSRGRYEGLWRTAWADFLGVLPYLLLGISIGSVIYGYLPTELLQRYAGADSPWAIPMAAVIGVPLYIRAEAVIPLAGALLAKGVGAGAILALIIGSAGASLTEVILLRALFRDGLLVAFVSVIFLMAILAGYAAHVFF